MKKNSKLLGLVSAFALASSALKAQDLQIEEYSSPNYSQGRKNQISKIVLHSTEGCGDSALRWLTNPSSKASSHYLIMEDGKTYNLVNDTNTAWHVGKGNSFTLGIELAGYADRPGFKFTDVQYTNAAVLVKQLMQNHNLSKQSIVSHRWVRDNIGGTNHSDPDPNFNWNRFYAILDNLDKKEDKKYELTVTIEEVASN